MNDIRYFTDFIEIIAFCGTFESEHLLELSRLCDGMGPHRIPSAQCIVFHSDSS